MHRCYISILACEAQHTAYFATAKGGKAFSLSLPPALTVDQASERARRVHGMRRGISSLAIVVLCASLATGGASAGQRRATAALTIYAGSSMTTVLPQLDPGNKYSFGSSGTLATQITNGAPVDVFMSANTTTPATLFAAGAIEKPVNFTRNALAIVVPKSNPAGIKSIYDLTKPGIEIAEAAASVPVGSYTVQVLNRMGINAAVQARVVSQETSDANVVTKVVLGQVDAGFVYRSDYAIDPDHLTLVTVPAWAQPKITYSMAIVTKSPNRAAAQAWIDKVLSPAGQAIFVKNGFLPLTAHAPTIAGFAPAKAKAGARVALTGTNFAHTTSVTIQGVAAKFKIASPTKITITIPAKARSGAITVTNPSGTATSKRFVIG
jgi:molybdate transport system substrate-binding protein